MYKKNLRKFYLSKRRELTLKNIFEASFNVFCLLKSINIWGKYYFHIFLPIQKFNELNTYPIINYLFKLNKKIVVPKSNFSIISMETCLLQKKTELELSRYGIFEPIKVKKINPLLIDIIFIPLLIFDNYGYRIGYGKGFYDKFLIFCNKKILKIGLSLFDPINYISDINNTDLILDISISPKKIYYF